MSQNNKLVNVSGLHVHFPVFGGVFSKKVASVKAVDGISFSISKNQTVGMVGESGCGKTTVGRAMINILHHVAPDVEIEGEINYQFDNEVIDFTKLDPKKMQKFRSKVQMIFQDPYASLNPRMTVAQIISEPLQIHTAMKSNEMQERVGWLLEKVGLRPEQSQRFPHEFSGGQRQRVAVGRAIVRQPSVFLFDEPLSNLDAKLRVQMRVELSQLHNEIDTTMIYVTHDQVEAMTMGDRIVVMNEGLIQQVADPVTLYDRPANKFVASFIGTPPMNFFNGQVLGQNSSMAFLSEDGL